MPDIQLRKFNSLSDFTRKLLLLFSGPTFLMTLIKIPGELREKIFLTVSITNNCYG